MIITKENERLLMNVWGVVIDAPEYHLLLSGGDESPKELEKFKVSHAEFFQYWLKAATTENIEKATLTQMGQYVMFKHCYVQLGNEELQAQAVQQ